MSDSLQKALSLLPHGAEFRFVERLISLEPGCSGTAEYTVRGDEPFLRGHFPSQPLFPGVLLAEAAAQLAGIVAQSDPEIGALPGLKLTALRSVKILGSAVPGNVVRLDAQVTGRLGNLIQADVKASVNEQIVMTGQLTLSGETA
jgi:3-hydroxyacyl-[acyl-carrier-protein] dehydratase